MSENRSERPTQRRLEQARREGRVAVSPAAAVAAGFILPLLVAALLLPRAAFRLIGTARASALMLLGLPLEAEAAERWGLIWKCVDDDLLMDEAGALARHLATQATGALALTKRALDRSLENSLEAQLAFEAELQAEAIHGADFAEGLTAFLQKRAPAFKGR